MKYFQQLSKKIWDKKIILFLNKTIYNVQIQNKTFKSEVNKWMNTYLKCNGSLGMDLNIVKWWERLKIFGSWIFTTDQYDPQKNKFQERILLQLRSCLSDTYDPNAIRYFNLNNDYFFSVMISQTKFTIEMIWRMMMLHNN